MRSSVRGLCGSSPGRAPRDRDGSFEPKIVKKRQKRLGAVLDRAIRRHTDAVICRLRFPIHLSH
ncbi:hypothetical protein ACIQFZ_29225 [Streptomyces sp. NPDC093064]|uniref:hypothetical protein n=1 Tax=Streptomyces sp. NPDC093064 TaxID=3366020 RepID=UPI00381FDC9D